MGAVLDPATAQRLREHGVISANCRRTVDVEA
jgi:hypothetical protein